MQNFANIATFPAESNCKKNFIISMPKPQYNECSVLTLEILGTHRSVNLKETIMTKLSRCLLSLFFFLISSIGIGATAQADVKRSPKDYGEPALLNATKKEIFISPDTKYVNVTDGETVIFVAGSQRFAWHFNTFPDTTHIGLASIAPPEFPAQNVTVYIAANPLYRN